MNTRLTVHLQPDADQRAKLVALQSAFADACNALAPVVQRHACWNRVALHHLTYRDLRQRFPSLGSQMACNAIYSVSRTCRLVYQHPDSPFNLQCLAGRPLPRLYFQPQSPVYFDRHTLSLRNGQVSLFTLDGRMRFQIALSESDEQRFRTQKLREIVLARTSTGFALRFHFALGEGEAPGEDADEALADGPGRVGRPQAATELPEYVLVIEEGQSPSHPAVTGPTAWSTPPAAERQPLAGGAS